MSDYTQEQLEGWNRLKLRRLAKQMQLDMDEVDGKKPSAIIKMILESQGDGEAEETKKKKGGKKKLGKKARQKAAPEPEPVEEEEEVVEGETGEVSGEMAELYNLMVDQSEKLDAFIETCSKQQATIMRGVETAQKLQELTLEMILVQLKMLHDEEIVPSDGTKELEKLEKELGLGEE